MQPQHCAPQAGLYLVGGLFQWVSCIGVTCVGSARNVEQGYQEGLAQPPSSPASLPHCSSHLPPLLMGTPAWGREFRFCSLAKHSIPGLEAPGKGAPLTKAVLSFLFAGLSLRELYRCCKEAATSAHLQMFLYQTPKAPASAKPAASLPWDQGWWPQRGPWCQLLTLPCLLHTEGCIPCKLQPPGICFHVSRQDNLWLRWFRKWSTALAPVG